MKTPLCFLNMLFHYSWIKLSSFTLTNPACRSRRTHEPPANARSQLVMSLWAADHRNCLSLWITETNQKQAVSSWTCVRLRCFLTPHWDMYVPWHDLPPHSTTHLLFSILSTSRMQRQTWEERSARNSKQPRSGVAERGEPCFTRNKCSLLFWFIYSARYLNN